MAVNERLPLPDKPRPRRAAAPRRVELLTGVVREVRSDLRPDDAALSRAHIEQLRQEGVLREEVVAVARGVFGDAGALRIDADLDSYGPWAT